MIVRMQRVTVLAAPSDRERMLAVLRRLGVIHLDPVQVPKGPGLDEAHQALARVTRVLDALPPGMGFEPGKAVDPDTLDGVHGAPDSELVEEAWHLLERRKELGDTIEDLRRERDRIAPFGDFDPLMVKALREKGVWLRLFHATAGKELNIPEEALLLELARDKGRVWFAVVSLEPVDIPAEEVFLPDKSNTGLQDAMQAAQADLERIGRRLGEIAVARARIERVRGEAQTAVEFAEAHHGMGIADPVTYVRGYCPAGEVDLLRDWARREGWGLVAEEPEPDEPVPTLLRNPGWIRPIEPVFRLIGVLPGYREIDVSAAFLFFLSLFFAMLVGDAGYGALFLALTLWAERKFRQGSPTLFLLLKVMSVATIVWGVLTGNYFGILSVPAPLLALQVGWLKDDSNLMFLCFLIGATHLSLAHIWTALRTWNSPQALAHLGWIGTTWTMFFAARNMVLGTEFPETMLWVFAASILVIVLFMTPRRDLRTEWFNHMMLPLTLVSNFVDVVSYIRLYAVGVAGFTVASSFNAMAAAAAQDWISGLIAAVLLFLGHALNITLCAMGVLVHGVRLNVLEFSSHAGMRWTGHPYRPFRDGSEREAAGRI